MIRSIFLVLCLSLGFQSLSAQIIKDSSKSIRLNFGFPELQVEDDIQFQDQNDNNIIDPSEGGLISFTIKNVGKYPAKNVAVFPKELSGVPGLELPEKQEIGDLAPGESKLVEVGLFAEENLEKGTANFIFEIHENGEYENISVVYALDTSQ